jgi:hypothetical protein
MLRTIRKRLSKTDLQILFNLVLDKRTTSTAALEALGIHPAKSVKAKCATDVEGV